MEIKKGQTYKKIVKSKDHKEKKKEIWRVIETSTRVVVCAKIVNNKINLNIRECFTQRELKNMQEI